MARTPRRGTRDGYRQNLPNRGPVRPARPSAPARQFPPAWNWLVDEAVPSWVKRKYSPKESWRDKPFGLEDSRFFFRGIEELSVLFTEERPRAIPAYLNHPKFRSAYLLYFLPLQAAKFLSLFELHPEALRSALTHAKCGKMTVLDLGAGPGTASLALMLRLLQEKQDIPRLEFHWFDLNREIMEDGKGLALELASHFPALRGKVEIHLHVAPWWKATAEPIEQASLILMGHLLNESPEGRGLDGNPQTLRTWKALLERAHGAGALLVEPAGRRSSQQLSRLRDELILAQLVPHKATSIWGPCLHAERCPLAQGRDWCHFSVPAEIPGKWFRIFSKGLGSERHWLKFSYIWLAGKGAPAPLPDPSLRRVISDPLMKGQTSSVLLCEPETPGRLSGPQASRLYRGDLWRTQK